MIQPFRQQYLFNLTDVDPYRVDLLPDVGSVALVVGQSVETVQVVFHAEERRRAARRRLGRRHRRGRRGRRRRSRRWSRSGAVVRHSSPAGEKKKKKRSLFDHSFPFKSGYVKTAVPQSFRLFSSKE